MFFRRDRYNKIQQVVDGTLIFREFDQQGKLLREELESLRLHFYSYPELVALFHLAGLEIEQEYGTYDLKPFDNDASVMIFVLQHKK